MTNGRFSLPDWVVDHVMGALEGNELKVLLAYARFANSEGHTWPSIETVSRVSGTSRRTAQRWTRALAGPGGLMVKVSSGKGGRETTRYRMFTQTWFEYHRLHKKGRHEGVTGEGRT